MNKVCFFIVVLGACGPSSDRSTSLSDQIPPEATVQDYESIPGLKRAIVKSEGLTIAEGDFLDGLHHGTWTTYDPTGKITTITTYLNGLKQGVELTFDNLGYVSSKAYYHNDQLDGEYLMYKRRNIVERRNYNLGVLNGLQQKFYPDGVVMEESTYVNNKIDGVAKWYDQKGNLKIQYTYAMGELVEGANSSAD